MNFLLDTNHWSYLQRSHPSVLRRLRSLPPTSRIYMPVVAQAELLLGVELVADEKRRAALRKLYECTLADVAEILPLDSEVAEQFARITAQLRRDGRPLATTDL